MPDPASAPEGKAIDATAADATVCAAEKLARRRAAEFLADEATEAAANLAAVARYARDNDWEELEKMTVAEATKHLAAVMEAAKSAAVTSSWPDGASKTVAPVAAQPEDVFALNFIDDGEWILRGVGTITLVDPGHPALRHFPCGPNIERGPAHYVANRVTLMRMRRLTPAEISEQDALESQREQDLEGMYATGQLDDPDLGKDLDYDDESELDHA